ncbi:MAG TPA: hypothetical protein VHO84_00620 [Syntrophorhabdaceae bacterium]|nr:hypothetical protein [Syntrophorhabdaceae bacterium]
MGLKHRFEKRSNYLYVEMTGDFIAFEADRIVIEAAETAETGYLKGVLYDMSSVTDFDPELNESYAFVDVLSNLLPATLKYAFLVGPLLLSEREYLDLVFVNKGIRVKTTSDMQEAIDWVSMP